MVVWYMNAGFRPQSRSGIPLLLLFASGAYATPALNRKVQYGHQS